MATRARRDMTVEEFDAWADVRHQGQMMRELSMALPEI